MKKNFFLPLLILIACSSSKKFEIVHNNANTEQIFLDDPRQSKPGKCYSKMMLNNNTLWTEILCSKELTKNIIEQIQTDLVRLYYKIDDGEVAKSQMGSSTKKALTDFQKKNGMAHGGLDWATINRLKIARE